jgi:exonuclease III
VKVLKKIYQGKCPPKHAGVAILISDRVDCRPLMVKWDKGYFILIKVPIHQKEITIINLYSPNESAPNFIKHTPRDLEAHIDSSTVVVGDFNTTLLPIDRSCKQKNQQRNPRI